MAVCGRPSDPERVGGLLLLAPPDVVRVFGVPEVFIPVTEPFLCPGEVSPLLGARGFEGDV